MPVTPEDRAYPRDDGPAPDGEVASNPAPDEVAETLPLEAVSDDAFADAVLRRLGERDGGRYAVRGEVAQGGQGVVLRVWDEDLHRQLAMKVMLGRDEDGGAGGGTPRTDARSLGRFLDEAQVTGQLDHPGIVPVHELGLDPGGRIYFTMKLVSGRDLRKTYELARAEEEGWNLTRALGVLLKVCEAMAYAHAKGVIHRDLKPSNVMVGRFGEVYVMDWGLARVEGKDDGRDLRILPDAALTSAVRTDRAEASGPDSPLITMDGDIVGTPAYMCPEQARGEIDAMGPHSDVYSVGAMLYELLCGSMPYVRPGMRVNSYAIWARVQEGPPLPVETLAPEVPGELAAICEKAMARPIDDRYPDMGALADDLRAFLEGRVVHAYETGAVAELRKWIVRNKPLAGALAAAVVLLVAGLIVSWTYYVRAEDNATLAAANAQEASLRADEAAEHAARAAENEQRALAEAERAAQNETLALAEKQRADERAAEVLGLSDVRRVRLLQERAATLWPPHPDKRLPIDAWLDEVADLGGRLDVHRGTLARLAAAPSLTTGEAWQHDVLAELVPAIETLTSAAVIGEMEQRRAIAGAIGEATVTGERVARLWSQAIEAIAASPRYGGLVIGPQMGLVPLGADPRSGLWEFVHVLSGTVPRRDAAGDLVLDERMGVVLVLLPGGTTWHGAQKEDREAPNHDPGTTDGERPVRQVTLGPFLMSKYEMTQGQWKKLSGENPSWSNPRTVPTGGRMASYLNPVEQVTWTECRDLLERWGLTLPTETQWEHGARAGTSTPWWTGDAVESLEGAGNISDRSRSDGDGPRRANDDYELWLDDGYAHHAPVGRYRPNAFGLHDTIGNLWEWCRDFRAPYSRDVTEGDGERIVQDGRQRIHRGGSFYSMAPGVRSALRRNGDPDQHDIGIGVRPSRALEP